MTKISVGGGGGGERKPKPRVRHPQTKVAKGTNDLGRALGKAFGAPQRATTKNPPSRLVDPVVHPDKAGRLHNPKGSGNLVRSQTSINRGRANSKHLPRAVRREAQRQVSQHDREQLLKGLGTIAAATHPLSTVKAPDKIDAIVSHVLGGHHHDPIHDALGAVGVKVPGIGDIGRGALAALYGVGRATVEHPGDVVGHTVKSIPNVATGTAGAIAEAVTHPKQFAEQMAKQIPADYQRRYGGSSNPITNPGGFRARIRKEGALPEIIDTASVAAPEGAVLGRSLQKAAEGGALGKVAKEVASAPRPKLRVTAGTHGAVEQELSPNLFRNVGRRVVDNRRAAAYEKKVRVAAERRAEGKPAGVTGLVPNDGEVVKATAHAQERAQRKAVAARQARGRSRLTRVMERETRVAQKELYRGLDKHERQAVGLTMSIGLPRDVKAAVRELRARRDQILAQREKGQHLLTGHDELHTIDAILADPEKFLTPRMHDIADAQIARAKRTATLDPNLVGEQATLRQYADQAAHLGIKRKALEDGTLEPAADFVARVQKAAAERGLKEPGYLFAGDTGGFGSFTAGAGNRAVAGNRTHKGIRFREGTRDVSPEAVVLGPQRNIKRAINWNTVSDIWEHNTPEWGRNRPIRELKQEILKRGLDPREWRFVDPAQFRRVGKDVADVERDPAAHSGLHEAISHNTFTLDAVPAEFNSTNRRLSLVHKSVAEELEHSTRPSGPGTRAWQKVQGGTSRLILNYNPTFVPVQVVSNTPLAALAMKGDVRNIVRSHRLFKSLDPEARDFVEDFMGISASSAFGKSPRMGASADTRFAKFLEATVDNPKWRAWREGHANPLNWNPWLDEKQNAFFRRAVFTGYAKKERAIRLGDDMKSIAKDAPTLVDLLKMPPGPERTAAFRANEHVFEKVADRASDMLGEYARYTYRERKILKNSLLFYGFLRWSVRFAFYTLPVKHPIAASLAAKLGQLHDEEVVDLLSSAGAAKGMGSKEAIAEVLRKGAMPYVFGRVWLTKKGELESIDLTRVNPMLNPIMDALSKGPVGAAAGLISPAIAPLADIAYGKDQFTGQDLTDADGQKIDSSSPLLEQARVWAGSFGNTAFPLRVGQKLLHPEEQASDSVPIIAPSAKKPSGPTDQARQAQKRAERGSNAEVLKDSLLPLVSSKRDGTLRGIAANMQKKGKVKKKSSGGGDWNFSSGGSSSGGSTSSSDWNFR